MNSNCWCSFVVPACTPDCICRWFLPDSSARAAKATRKLGPTRLNPSTTMKTSLPCLLIVSLGLSLPQIYAAELVFFGNLHSHTSYSDGSGTPDQAYKYARDTAKVDFL